MNQLISKSTNKANRQSEASCLQL